MAARLVAEGLGLQAEGHWLIRGASLAVEAGAIHAIVGPNGAGKTSLLRCLGLVVPPSEGRVLLGGCDAIDRWPNCLELRRRVSFVQQRPALFRASVFDNVAAGLRFRGCRGEDLRRGVAEALRLTGLADYERRWPGSLSGGEAQKVALARAVATRPEVLLLDEPCASLDPSSSAAIEDGVRLLAARGMSVILVTHSLAQAARLSDTLHVICEGRLVESGPTAEVLSQPRQTVSRQFIDSGRLP